MSDTKPTAAEINRRFAERILASAADIVEREQPADRPDAIAAILQAKKQILSAEPDDHRALRSYGGSEIIPDFGRYVAKQFPEFKSLTGFGLTIGPWCRLQNTRALAEVLRSAGPAIGDTIAHRTVMAEQRNRLNDSEADQLVTLDHFQVFLRQSKATVDIYWDKPYDAYPAEFGGAINGTRWSLNVVQLTHAGAVFAAGDNRPSSPVLAALSFAFEQGTKTASRTSAADNRRCLVVHNREFTQPYLWDNIALSTGPFDALAILHEDEATATRAWQFYPADAFGIGIPSRTVLSLNDTVQRRLAERPDMNPEALRRAWSAVADARLTDPDILHIVQQG